ncbi:MAG: purine-nucleoside phosphorylase [Gammaproteobacteria bacterium]|nr:purine-nucleoside phosphorylase [Gammaproteobacteria bacterium]MDH3769095.1 purine-nucleoside phosphorylase [Gammaproteobacteria bacterium]
MSTKHMNAARGDFAETVLMPGDPLRAQYIAETYLDDARQVTDVRNMLGFTGAYRGIPVSVMAHGMGIPSLSIYVTELMTEYGAKRIIRVGSCGTVNAGTQLRDIIIAMGACTDSSVNRVRFGGYDYACIASFELLQNAVRVATEHKVRYQVGNIFSADLFYTADVPMFDTMEKFNILGLEMEAAGLYALAAEHGVDALAICTVSDNIRTGAALTADERSSTFDEMIKIALDTVVISV